MSDLHLVGVQDDGEHLILSAADGTRYRLPIDDALRAAARRDRPRLGQLQIEIGGLRPREVQELIRSGLSAQEVAERSGWTVEKVRRFETPILAERDHVAGLARQTRVGAGMNADETLGARVLERLKSRDVPREQVLWDSARGESGVWTVRVTFRAGGRERTALWRFDPKTRYLRALNDDARWLGEDDSPESAIPTPHVATSSTPADTVYDVEVDGGLRHHPTHAVEDDLSDSVRALARSRGRARGHTQRSASSPSRTPGGGAPRTDALPIEELAVPLEVLGPPPDRSHADVPDELAAPPEPVGSEVGQPAGEESASRGDGGSSGDDASGEGSETAIGAAAGEDPAPSGSPPGRPASPAAQAGSRKGRARVPNWDDIVFGTKSRGSS